MLYVVVLSKHPQYLIPPAFVGLRSIAIEFSMKNKVEPCKIGGVLRRIKLFSNINFWC